MGKGIVKYREYSDHGKAIVQGSIKTDGVWKPFAEKFGDGKADQRAVKRTPCDPQNDEQEVSHYFFPLHPGRDL